jgi:hypothetical protein
MRRILFALLLVVLSSVAARSQNCTKDPEEDGKSCAFKMELRTRTIISCRAPDDLDKAILFQRSLNAGEEAARWFRTSRCYWIERTDGPFWVTRGHRGDGSDRYCRVHKLFGQPPLWVLCGEMRVLNNGVGRVWDDEAEVDYEIEHFKF